MALPQLSHRLVVMVAVIALMLASLRWLPMSPIIAYASIFISSSILYWFIARESLKSVPSVTGLLPLLLLLLIVRTSYFGMQPLGSDDVYRYIWDGKVQTAGVNPYAHAPLDPSLQHLHTDRLPSLVNHPEMKTIYFPLSQWLFYLGYHLSGEQVWGVQFLIFLAEVLTFTALFLLLKAYSSSPWRALIYAANPLILLQFSLDAHVDVFGFPLLLFGLLLYVKGRKSLSFTLIGLSLLIKPVALVILPLLFLNERGTLNKAKVIAIPLAVALIPFVPYLPGANPLEALTTFSKHWYFNGALFSVLHPLFSDNQTTRLWCFGALGLALLLLYASTKSLQEKMVLAVLLLLLCSPVAHPWYMGWLIVLLPLAPLSSGIMLATTMSLTSVTFVTYQLNGLWKEYPIVLVLEYAPVLYCLGRDLWKKNNGVPVQAGKV